ncbi:putative juxtaposed with another zinc finger protein 1-like [Apostichopus japonicus]|uniref:Putative juxtaposed with another zinc finger protein 1-like n=1 Tax=Stichopus japonicus TaxID=307972 RepID=A0A2G8L5R5_STIJA|nr:putative juxtaposed with another zinc finger protein 1-like [Apostichopus japonicus]
MHFILGFVTDAAKHQPKEKKKTKLYRGSSPKRLLIGSREDLDRLNSDSDSEESILLKLGSPYNADLVLQNRSSSEGTKSKPFLCPVPGCKKRYKNINGMKYHSRNGHRKEKDKSETKIRKTYKCDCGKSYRSAQGLRQHVIAQHPPTSLGSSPSPSPKQTIASPAPTATTTITPSIFATGHVGLSLANGSILLEPCTTTLGNAGIVVEPGTPVTPTSQSARLVTPSTPPTGFTIVTLPSASLGKVSSLVSSPRQPQSADCAIRKAQTAIKLESLPLIEKTTTNISAKVQQVKTEGES